MSLLTRIDEVSGKRKFKKVWFGIVCLLFLGLIILPSIYVLFEAVGKWDSLTEVWNDSEKMGWIYSALINSFSIALIVTILDIIVGLPMAWIMVRKDFPGKKYLDTLIDMPLAFPTSALGFSVAIFWAMPDIEMTIPGLGIVVNPYVLIILLHLIFTFPYMVRCLSGILEQIDQNCETAGMTLGASRFTAVRTITLPLFRAGLITGFILCFARSLSETGGTLIALRMIGAEHSFFTGPTFIAMMKEGGGDATPDLIFISVILIILAIVFLFVAKYLMSRLKIPWSKVWPKWERKVSRGLAVKVKDNFTIIFMIIMILLPSFFIFTFLFAEPSSIAYGELMSSIGLSFMIATVAVAFSVVFGIPMAIYIARNGNTKLGKILDNLINVPLIIPTTALGFSLGLFWGELNMSSLGILLVIFGHIAFTYPLLVRNIIGAIEEVDPAYEEISRTLGAKPFQAFRKVLLPIIQSSVIGGCILAFTRSLGETGATIAIDKTVMTVPVYIDKLIKGAMATGDSVYPAAIASIVLILICFVMMFLVRYVTKKKGAE